MLLVIGAEATVRYERKCSQHARRCPHSWPLGTDVVLRPENLLQMKTWRQVRLCGVAKMTLLEGAGQGGAAAAVTPAVRVMGTWALCRNTQSSREGGCIQTARTSHLEDDCEHRPGPSAVGTQHGRSLAGRAGRWVPMTRKVMMETVTGLATCASQ